MKIRLAQPNFVEFGLRLSLATICEGFFGLKIILLNIFLVEQIIYTIIFWDDNLFYLGNFFGWNFFSWRKIFVWREGFNKKNIKSYGIFHTEGGGLPDFHNFFGENNCFFPLKLQRWSEWSKSSRKLKILIFYQVRNPDC